ncbi:phage holin, partial [Staphylococcus aureus]
MINLKIRIKPKTFCVARLLSSFLFAPNIAKAIGYDIQVYT